MSSLGKTWLFDLDGTILKHNGYKIDGIDTVLPRAKEFLDALPDEDVIVFLTSRKEEYREQTIQFLNYNKIRYSEIIFNLPYGERILINDAKPSGLKTSYGINTQRDVFMSDEFIICDDI